MSFVKLNTALRFRIRPEDLYNLQPVLEAKMHAHQPENSGIFLLDPGRLPTLKKSILQLKIVPSTITYHPVTDGVWRLSYNTPTKELTVENWWRKMMKIKEEGIEPIDTVQLQRDLDKEKSMAFFDVDLFERLGQGLTKVVYGLEQSGLPENVGGFDWERLPGPLTSVNGGLGGGYDEAWTYYGSPYAPFSWHLEDMNLMSMNYLLEGAPKVWWSICPSQNAKFEAVVQELLGMDCSHLLRHEKVVIDPRVLRSKGIRVFTTVQRAGEIVITHPLGYHSGYNTGYNIAESRNITAGDWELYVRMASTQLCKCPNAPRDSWEALMEGLAKLGVGKGFPGNIPVGSTPLYHGEDGWRQVTGMYSRIQSWTWVKNVGIRD